MIRNNLLQREWLKLNRLIRIVISSNCAGNDRYNFDDDDIDDVMMLGLYLSLIVIPVVKLKGTTTIITIITMITINDHT